MGQVNASLSLIDSTGNTVSAGAVSRGIGGEGEGGASIVRVHSGTEESK